MKYIKYMFFAMRQCLIYLLSALTPKNSKIWVFGAWQGKIYADNSKYLFEYVSCAHPDIQCVWVSKNDDVIRKVRENGRLAYKIKSFRALWYLLRASIVVQTEGNKDIGGYRLARTKIIQLWHGVAPKKVDWSTDRSAFKKKLDTMLFDNHAKSYWMTSSEQNSKTMQDLMGYEDGQAFATGYPRNDIFVNTSEISDVRKDLDQKYPDCKKIIYMPTHRNFGTQGAEFSEKDMLLLDHRLREHRIVMVFKPHIHELKNYLHLEETFTNIVLAKDVKYSDVYSYIKDFDLLISDYSSIIYDFTCAKKPIVLFPYDLEKFKNKDAGLFDYFEMIPAGPFCYTWSDVMEQVVSLLKQDTWREKREACRMVFHPFDDGKNCERVYSVIVDKILKK